MAGDRGQQAGGPSDYQRKVISLDQEATIRGGTGPACSMDSLWESLISSGAADLLNLAQSQPTTEGAADELRPTGRGSGRCQELIVVASLIDKIPNLAGLARTCEVFRAALLVVPDIRLAADPLFSSISVTAEQWVPMVEVPEPALLPWLERKQAEGYTLVGLEQTADSVTLPEFRWPARCVLVLGREREGMPPEVMQLLDHTVEIPQLGLIRSLNVHVSGAISMYEYTRQQLGLGTAAKHG